MCSVKLLPTCTFFTDTKRLLRFRKCHYLIRQWTNIPKIGTTHQDENNETDTVGLYSRKKCCQCNTIPCAVFHDVNVTTLHHNFMLHIWKP